MAKFSDVGQPRVVTSGSGAGPVAAGQGSLYSSAWDCGVFDLPAFDGDGVAPPAPKPKPRPARRWSPGFGQRGPCGAP
jgi:hypothetical protein